MSEELLKTEEDEDFVEETFTEENTDDLEPKKEEPKEKPKSTKKKQEEPKIDKDIVVEEISAADPEKVLNKTHVAYLKFKKGEMVWFCNFCGEIERGKTIFNKLENKYKFRPRYAKINTVLINEYLEPLYQFEGVSGYHTEDKLFDNEKECKDYCDELN